MDGRVIVKLDLHPARVRVAGTSYNSLRAVLTDTELIAYRLGPSGPEEVFRSAVVGDADGLMSTGFIIPTEAGNVTVESGGGCSGCGNKLGAIDLFPGLQRVMVGMRR